MPELTAEMRRELTALDDVLAGRPVDAELAVLGELAVAVRAERPAPAPAWAARLDERVRRGFAAERRARRQRWRAPGIGVAVAAALAVLVFVMPHVGGREESGDSGSGGAVQGESAVPRAADSAAPSAAQSVVPSAAGSAGSDARTDRRVERAAELTLATRPGRIDAVSRGIQAVTRRYKGFVVSSTVTSRQGGSFQLRIPTRNLDAALAALADLGAVRSRSQSAQDITAESVSARDRLTEARTERKSLLRQLGRADTLAEAASVRARLRIVAREIRQARGAVRRVQNRARFATVNVELVADASAGGSGSGDDGSWTPGDAARDALRVLEWSAGAALVGLAVAVPLALLAALAAGATRWGGRRRRERALDAI
jgi:Domain of unknown function (DUF4349)